MKTSPTGINFIKTFEGRSLKAYLCPAGVWTIGYGHTGPDVFEGQTIKPYQADRMLERDLERFERCVSKACPNANQSQFDAMVSLAFNIGEAAFAKSSVARLHKAGRYPEAQQAFLLWNKARIKGNLKVVNGLNDRRSKEAEMYDNEDLPTDIDGMPQAVEGEQPSSRVINGSSIAGGATVASMAAPTVVDSLGEVKTTLLEFMPYLDGINWNLVLGGIALAGIAYAVYARIMDRREGRA